MLDNPRSFQAIQHILKVEPRCVHFAVRLGSEGSYS
jgi:hypothetical protein